MMTGGGDVNLWLSWGIFSIIFVTVGVVGGYLSEELLRTSLSLKEKQRKLEKVTALHEQILSNMPTGLLTVDSRMRVNFINPAGEHILGKAGALIVGRNLGEVEHGLVPFFEKLESREVSAEGGEEDARRDRRDPRAAGAGPAGGERQNRRRPRVAAIPGRADLDAPALEERAPE